MRTRVLVVATLVLLAGASSALAGAPAGTHADVHAHGDAVAQEDAQNATEVSYQNLTMQRLQLTNVSVQQTVLNETELQGNVTEVPDSLGTATASNLTLVNATLRNVTLQDVTFRSEEVVEQLFGGETPEGENATLENASIENVSVDSLVVDSGVLESVEVNNVSAAFAPGGANATQVEGQPTLEVGNMTVGDATLDGIDAGSVSVENASVGIGLLAGGGPGDGETTTEAGTETGGNATGALGAPER